MEIKIKHLQSNYIKIMKSKIEIGARWLTGVIFLVFGANKFLNFIPMPEPPPAELAVFQGFMASKYLMPLIGLVEIVAGLLFIINRYVALGLVIIAPIVVNIVLFHAFLGPEGLPMGIFLLVATGFLFLFHKEKFQGVIAAK